MMSYQVIADLFIIIDPKFYITTPQKWTAFHFLSSNIFIIISFLHQFPPQNPIHIPPHAESIPVSQPIPICAFVHNRRVAQVSGKRPTS